MRVEDSGWVITATEAERIAEDEALASCSWLTGWDDFVASQQSQDDTTPGAFPRAAENDAITINTHQTSDTNLLAGLLKGVVADAQSIAPLQGIEDSDVVPAGTTQPPGRSVLP